MREIGRAIERLDAARAVPHGRFDVTARVEGQAAAARRRCAHRGFQRTLDRGGIGTRRRRRAPFDLQRVGTALRVPRAQADHRDAGGRSGVRAATARRARHRARLRTSSTLPMRPTLPPSIGQCRTDANSRPGSRTSMPKRALPSIFAAISMRGCVLPINVHCSGGFVPTRPGGVAAACGRELTVVRALPGPVPHHAVADAQLGHRQLPAQCGGPEQLRARGGGGEAQRPPCIGDARRAAGDADAELARDLEQHPAADAHAARLAARLAGFGGCSGSIAMLLATLPYSASAPASNNDTRDNATSSSSATKVASAVCTP